MITYRLLVSSPFLIISGERACEWAVLMREFSRLPQMESLLARGVLKTRGRGRGRGGRGAGARCGVYLFFRVRVSVNPNPNPNPNPKTAFFKKERPRLRHRPRHIPLRSRGLLLGCSERANTK